MKKVIMAGLLATSITIGSLAAVSGQEQAADQPKPASSNQALTTTIDGIDVPWSVLEYAQLKYEGHAVTKATKNRRAGIEVYRLRVDRDDLANDYESIALVFDMNWKLLGEEKHLGPPPKPKEEAEEPKEETPASSAEQRNEGANQGAPENQDESENGSGEEEAAEDGGEDDPDGQGEDSGESPPEE